MPRTRADVVVSGGKTSKAACAPASASCSTSGATPKKKSADSGSNPVVVRPTPAWQRNLDSFIRRDGGEKEKRGESSRSACEGERAVEEVNEENVSPNRD